MFCINKLNRWPIILNVKYLSVRDWAIVRVYECRDCLVKQVRRAHTS